MTDFLSDGGYITNLAAIILSFGWLFVGLAFGYVTGYDKAERQAHERVRAMLAHPSNS